MLTARRSILGFLAAVASSLSLEAREPRLEEGRAFPEVPFTRLEDDAVRYLSSFRGRKLILHIFASW